MANDDPIAPLREVSESWKALEAQLRAVREQIEAPSRAVDTMKEQLDAPRRAIEALQRQLDTPLRAISQQAQEVHNAIAGLVMGPLTQSREAIGRIPELSEVSALEQWRTSYLGRRSELVSALTRLGSVPPEHRRVAGQPLNLARSALEQAYDLRKAELSQMALSQQLERDRIDVTLPGRPLARGCSHPSIMVIREISDLFRRIGFQVIEGPEVEWEHYNFTMLGIPPDHPARDLTDTFWITDKMLLRTHTSPNQIRAMERVGRPPIRVLVPGRCYRNEATDASHESTFFQIEGLMVDDRTTMADMKGVLSYMARGLFGQNARTRFRCDYFPFVEPGAEMSVSCGQCDGAGCRMCKYTGWLEILGCGMVHPDVLRGVNIDPERFSGWAFGLGVERIAILKYGVDDIRLFQQNDLRFLRQVG